nr:MAG TPA: hypothetical protein [Caudoviricetes sp.]
MEGEGSRRTGTLPHRSAPHFFPDGIFFEKSNHFDGGGGVATNRHPPASLGSSFFPRRDIFREVDYPDHVFWGFKWEHRLGPKQNSSLMAVAKTGGNSFRY